MTKSAICAATFVGLFSTSAIAQTEAEFQQLEDTFTAAFNKEDVSTIADMFAETIIFCQTTETSSRDARP